MTTTSWLVSSGDASALSALRQRFDAVHLRLVRADEDVHRGALENLTGEHVRRGEVQLDVGIARVLPPFRDLGEHVRQADRG